MLILTRRPGDTLLIAPRPESAGSDSLGWFVRPIEVRILRIDGKQVRVGVEAAESLLIVRGERGG